MHLSNITSEAGEVHATYVTSPFVFYQVYFLFQ